MKKIIATHKILPGSGAIHLNLKRGNFGNNPVGLVAHLVAGKHVAIDLFHHCEETKEAVETVEGRLLVDLPGVELQKAKLL